MAVADYMPHANDGPLKWQDQLEKKDCLVFSGKSQEDVVDWMCRLRSYMSFAQCNPNEGEAMDQKIQAVKFLIQQYLRKEPLKWWGDKENQLTNLHEWNQALQGLKKHFAPGGKIAIFAGTLMQLLKKCSQIKTSVACAQFDLKISSYCIGMLLR